MSNQDQFRMFFFLSSLFRSTLGESKMRRAFSIRAAGSFVWAAIAVLLLQAADRPRDRQQRIKETGTFRLVPAGSIRIPLRDVQQPNDYSCGAACFMAVCSYYNVGPKDMARSNLKCNNRKGRLHCPLRQSPPVSPGFRRLALSAEFTGAQAPLLRLKLESAPRIPPPERVCHSLGKNKVNQTRRWPIRGNPIRNPNQITLHIPLPTRCRTR